MNKTIPTSGYRYLTKLWVLIAMLMVSVSASALDLQTLDLNTKYPEANAVYQFTPAKSGVLTIWSQEQTVHVYTALNADASDVDYTTSISSFAYGSYTDNDVYFSKKTTSSVTAGETYYIVSSASLSANMVFMAVMDTDITELQVVSVSQPVGETYNIGDSRDGQVEIEFNLAATANDKATLTIGSHSATDIETIEDANSGKLIYALKPVLSEWLANGYFNAGDKMTLTITGLKSKADSNIIYGTDGTLVLEWLAPEKPHYLVSNTGVTEFLSYWVEGDARGITVLEFDYDLMTKENGQTATVNIQIGSAEADDFYSETIDADKITIDGKKMYIDFTGKLRSFEAMGLIYDIWNTMSVKVTGILMADGTHSFSETQGNYGSVAFEVPYTEYRSDIQAEFTPASESQLTENQFKVYFSDKAALTFTGVHITYQTQSDEKKEADITSGITSEDIGLSGIEYTIPLSDEIVAGKNIRVSFTGQVSADGYEHDFNVKYNPGLELVGDLQPVACSISEGEIATSVDNIALTFDTDVVINSVNAPETPVWIADQNNGTTIPASIAVAADNSKQVVITPNAELSHAHQFTLCVDSLVVVTPDYISNNGQYGHYMPGYQVNFKLNLQYSNYDFATDPIVGSTLESLSYVNCTTKEGADDTQAISATLNPDALVWIEDAEGTQVTECTVNTKIGNGFTIVPDNEITTTGNYTVVLQAGVYKVGDNVKEEEVRLNYTVHAAPVETITITATDPVSESTVTSLSEIMVEFSEPVYGNDTVITILNKAEYKTFSATLQVNPRLRTQGVITLDEEITDEGNYTVMIPNAVVGDELWFNNNGATGNCNLYTLFYFTVRTSSGGDNNWTTDPADGSVVTSLQVIKVWNNSVDEMGVGGGQISVKRNGVEIETVSQGDYGVDWNEIDLTLSQAYTEAGVYTLEVPAGFFLDGYGAALPAVTFTYTIEAPQWTTDPADGSVVTSLQVIKVWNNTVDEMGVGGGQISVKRNGVEIETISQGDYGVDWNEIDLTLSQAYTEAGVYTLEVPAGFFLDGNGAALPAVTFTYTIEAPQWTTDPADGSVVTSLQVIKVWNNTVDEMGVGGGQISVKRDGVEIETVSQGDYGVDWNEIDLTLSQAYTEAGVYTLEVPAGFFLDGYGAALPAVTFTYTINSATGIDSIFANENAAANVYTIDGKLIMTNAHKSDVMNLEQGVYIIGNQKVQIRK